MHLAASLIAAAAETEHHGNVALETLPFGLIAVACFAALGLVTLSYRNVANRHAHKAEAFAREHGKDDHAEHGH